MGKKSTCDGWPQAITARGDGFLPEPLGPPELTSCIATPLPKASSEIVQAVLIGETNGAKYLVGDFSSPPRGLTCPDFGDHATVLGVVGINLAASVLASNLCGGGL